MNQIKGSSVEFLRQYIKKFDPNMESAMIKLLDGQCRQVYNQAMSVGWVPVEVMDKLLIAFAQTLYADDRLEDAMEKIGYDMGQTQLSGIYRVIIKLSTLPMFVNKSAQLWRLYYKKGTGRAYMDSKSKTAVFSVKNYPDLPLSLRLATIGFIKAVGMLAGLNQVTVEHHQEQKRLWLWVASWQ